MDSSKNLKYQNIIEVCFRLVADFGAEKITISQVSKRSGISRGWIYKYIGKNIDEVLKYSLNEYAKDFSNISGLKIYEDENDLISYIGNYSLEMIDRIQKKPSILKLYFTEHDSDNMIGEIIRDVEKISIDILAVSIEKSFNLNYESAKLKAEKIIFMRMGALMLFFSKKKFLKTSGWEERFLNDLFCDLKALLFSDLALK
jgi:AcrR family transcriptional regulator